MLSRDFIKPRIVMQDEKQKPEYEENLYAAAI